MLKLCNALIWRYGHESNFKAQARLVTDIAKMIPMGIKSKKGLLEVLRRLQMKIKHETETYCELRRAADNFSGQIDR